MTDQLTAIADMSTGARRVLDEVEAAFQSAVAAVSKRCERGGRLDNGLLDQYQWASYELALGHAELLASRQVLDARDGTLDLRLGLAFVAEAVRSVLSRLDGIYLSVDLPADGLATIQASDALRQLRKQAGTPEALAKLGADVADTGADDLGQVDVDDQTALAGDAFRRFAEDVVVPLAEEIHRKDLTVPESLLGPMREMGVFGLSIPEQFGGASPADGENTPMMIAVTEALSEASLAAAGSLITRPEILTRALLAGGTQEQKERWLPRIAEGNPLCAIAITEPDYGSDAASLSLRGTKTEGGWLLNGAKTWCTFAGKAGLVMVVTRTNPDRSLGHKGLSLLLVEKPSFDGHEFRFEQEKGGVLTGRAIPTIGYRGMHSFDLTFEDFFVPDANVVGEEAGLGRGFYLTMAGMTGGRIQTAGRALGVMRAGLKAAIRYAQERKVFGAPLVEYQLTQIKIAQMAARFVACRFLAFAVGRMLDEGQGRVEASLVKLIACRSAEIITREALQIHGGMGYAEEMPVSRYWIDARVLSIFEGAEETLALKIIARDLLQGALPEAA